MNMSGMNLLSRKSLAEFNSGLDAVMMKATDLQEAPEKQKDDDEMESVTENKEEYWYDPGLSLRKMSRHYTML